MTDKNPNVLFLDDDNTRTKEFVSCFPFAKTAENTKQIIALIEAEAEKERMIDYLFLDHDLGGAVYVDSKSTDCGMEVVRQIIAKDLHKWLDCVIVHSLNEPAARLMCKALDEKGVLVERYPFPILLNAVKKGNFSL